MYNWWEWPQLGTWVGRCVGVRQYGVRGQPPPPLLTWSLGTVFTIHMVVATYLHCSHMECNKTERIIVSKGSDVSSLFIT